VDIPTNLLCEVTPGTIEALLAERRAGMIRWMAENQAYATAFDHAKDAFEKRQDRSQ